MNAPHMTRALPEATPSTLLAICLLSGLAASGFLLAPLFFGALAEAHGFGAADLGGIAAVGGVGGLITALSSPLWLPHAPLRQTAIGLVIAIVAALVLLLFFVRTPGEAMLAMGLHGLAMGTLYTLMFGAVSLYARPERTLGWKLGTESLPGLAMLYTISNFAIPRAGFTGLVTAVAVAALLLGLSAFLLPAVRPRHALPPVPPEAPKAPLGLWLAVAATLCLWGGVNSVWIFVERIGTARGISVAEIGTVLTLGWIFASLGGLAAGAVGSRFGTVKPFLVSTGAGLAALALFLDPSPMGYRLAASLFISASVFAAVYAIALITTLNAHPLFAGLPSAALQAAVVIGPPVGGAIYESRGAEGLFIFAATCIAASIFLYLQAGSGRRRAAQSGAAGRRGAPSEG